VLSPLQNLDWRGFLARSPLPPPSADALYALARQPILITGAGGSIGSALAQRLSVLRPPKLILLEASEGNLYALERDWAAGSMTPILGSAGDATLLNEIFQTHAPRIVFHAAAFKHVPLMEEQPLAAIQNNIFATDTLAQAAAAHGARVVLLSTDKAVQPASAMGATKRVCEQIVLARGGTALRLGNVLASRDSVAEVFQSKIMHGGPIPVTDPAARRYFLTIDEAVNLLLTAATFLEPSTLLAPVLTATHLIVDLARFMINEFSPNSGITIKFTGVRPGDKQAERLWLESDLRKPVGTGVLVAIENSALATGLLDAEIAALRTAFDVRNLSDALTHLFALVPDYTPSQTIIALAAQRGNQVGL
jgi:FlaA1/EpsC-like NDP-sugar epimerase